MARRRREEVEAEELIERNAPKVAEFLVKSTPHLTADQARFLEKMADCRSIDPATAAVLAQVHPDEVFEWLQPDPATGEMSTVARCVEYVKQAWLADHEAILSVSCFRKKETRGKSTPALAILNAHHLLYGRGKADVIKALKDARGEGPG